MISLDWCQWQTTRRVLMTSLIRFRMAQKTGCLAIQFGIVFAAACQRFLSDNTNCHVVSLYGSLTQFVSHKNVAMNISCFRLMHDERSVNSGQGAHRHRRSFLSFKFGCTISSAGKKDAKEQFSQHHLQWMFDSWRWISGSEMLKSPINHSQGSRVAWPMKRNQDSLSCPTLLGQVRNGRWRPPGHSHQSLCALHCSVWKCQTAGIEGIIFEQLVRIHPSWFLGHNCCHFSGQPWWGKFASVPWSVVKRQ